MTSYRRNRDYSKQFNWTYELKQDVYKCYLKAKEDPRLGYMKRMKRYWDEIHPELSHFSDKNLRDQATTVERRRVVMDTEFSNANENIATDQLISQETNNSVIDETNANNENPIDNNDSFAENNNRTLIENTNSELTDTLRNLFLTKYDTWKEKELAERNSIVNKKRINGDIMKAMDRVLLEHLRSFETINYWDINVSIYVATTAINEYNGEDTTKPNHTRKKNNTPKWLVILENSITSVRKLIAKLSVVIQCKKNNQFTEKQRKLKSWIERKFNSSNLRQLEYRLESLKHKLKATAAKLKYQKKLYERKQINRRFSSNPKYIYREMRGERITVNNVPTKIEVENFWKGLWNKKGSFNSHANWLDMLKTDYCTNIEPKNYRITNSIVLKVVKKLQLKKAPGPDMIGGFWYKKLSSYIPYLSNLFNQSLENNLELPQWLAKARTVLTPKNNDTANPKNYRPIACLNFMYKVYTGCINLFLCDHCETNNIVTDSQNGGKRNVWGTTEQLLLNKIVQKEAKSRKRNLITVWLDYKKAFDSVPHEWLLCALKLAKVPTNILNAIQNLTTIWSTNVTLQGLNDFIMTDDIKYEKGIFQGDSLSVILFVLSVNPLSHLLKKLKGYAAGPDKSINVTHNFFVDDLKLFGSSQVNINKMLDLVTVFSKDIDMHFGVDKCAYAKIVHGKQVKCTSKLKINNLEITPVEDGDTYRYLGQDENVEYVGKVNKDRVRKELF